MKQNFISEEEKARSAFEASSIDKRNARWRIEMLQKILAQHGFIIKEEGKTWTFALYFCITVIVWLGVIIVTAVLLSIHLKTLVLFILISIETALPLAFLGLITNIYKPATVTFKNNQNQDVITELSKLYIKKSS